MKYSYECYCTHKWDIFGYIKKDDYDAPGYPECPKCLNSGADLYNVEPVGEISALKAMEVIENKVFPFVREIESILIREGEEWYVELSVEHITPGIRAKIPRMIEANGEYVNVILVSDNETYDSIFLPSRKRYICQACFIGTVLLFCPICKEKIDKSVEAYLRRNERFIDWTERQKVKGYEDFRCLVTDGDYVDIAWWYHRRDCFACESIEDERITHFRSLPSPPPLEEI